MTVSRRSMLLGMASVAIAPAIPASEASQHVIVLPSQGGILPPLMAAQHIFPAGVHPFQRAMLESIFRPEVEGATVMWHPGPRFINPVRQ